MRTQILSKFYLYFFCTLSMGAAYGSLEKEDDLSADKETTSFYSPKRNASRRFAEESSWKDSVEKLAPYIATGVAFAASGATYYLLNSEPEKPVQNRINEVNGRLETNEAESAEEESAPTHENEREDYLPVQKVSLQKEEEVVRPKKEIARDRIASQRAEKPIIELEPKKKAIFTPSASPKPAKKNNPPAKPITHQKRGSSIVSTLSSQQQEGKQKKVVQNNGMKLPSAPPLSIDSSDEEEIPLSITQPGNEEHIEEENLTDSGSDMDTGSSSSGGFMGRFRNSKTKKKGKEQEEKKTKKKGKEQEEKKTKKKGKKQKNTKKKKKGKGRNEKKEALRAEKEKQKSRKKKSDESLRKPPVSSDIGTGSDSNSDSNNDYDSDSNSDYDSDSKNSSESASSNDSKPQKKGNRFMALFKRNTKPKNPSTEVADGKKISVAGDMHLV